MSPCVSRKWIFECQSSEDAEKALSAVDESQLKPSLGLLGLMGVCMESSSPEPTSGSASGTNRHFNFRLQQDFLEENDDPSDFNSLMQNHLRVI